MSMVVVVLVTTVAVDGGGAAVVTTRVVLSRLLLLLLLPTQIQIHIGMPKKRRQTMMEAVTPPPMAGPTLPDGTPGVMIMKQWYLQNIT